jgi:hypothetical protein
MPNWCENILTVAGLEADLEEFRRGQAVRGGENRSDELKLSFAASVPIPRPIPTLPSEYIRLLPSSPIHPMLLSFLSEARPTQVETVLTAWDWCEANWGTRQEPSDVGVTHDAARLEYRFLTAWSPPDEWLLRIGLRYPSLAFVLESLDLIWGAAQRIDVTNSRLTHQVTSDQGTCDVRTIALLRFRYRERDLWFL